MSQQSDYQVDITKPATYQAQAGQQTRFHESQAIFEVLYGGEAGGGKSAAIVAESVRQVKHSGYEGIIFRRTNDELEQIKKEARKMFPAAGGFYREGDNTGIFPSGARIYLRYMQYDQDRFKYQGREFQYIGFDELTHFTENQYTYLFSRCRTVDPTMACYVRSSANPGGTGHAWVKKRFIDKVPANSDRQAVPKSYLGGLNPDTDQWEEREVPPGTPFSSSRAFIPASRFDNKILMDADPNYEGRIRAMSDPLLAEALLTGNWDLFAGQFFTRFRKQIHIINSIPTKNEKIPPWWITGRGTDWGFAHACVTEWLTLDQHGNGYFFEELYRAERSPAWHAEHILKLDQDLRIQFAYTGRDTFARNPMAWKKDETPDFMPNSFADSFAENGVVLTAASQDRKQGWGLMHRMMDWEGQMLQNGSFEFEKAPKLFIIRGKCPYLVEQIVAATRKEDDPEDIPKIDDDAIEAARYALMHLNMDGALAPIPKKSWNQLEIERLLQITPQGSGGMYEWPN